MEESFPVATSIYTCAGLNTIPLPINDAQREVVRDVILTANVRLLVSKPGTVAMLDVRQAPFSATGPNATIANGAFVQQRGQILNGRGRFELQPFALGNIRTTLTGDLAQATGNLSKTVVNPSTGLTYRELTVSVPVTKLDGSADIELCLSGWRIRTAFARLSRTY